jgi:drug/metabolite transporter (DMT)-like permease
MMHVREGRVRLFAEGGLALTGLIWGLNFVLIKYTIGIMPPLYYLAARFLFATLVLVPFAARRLASLRRRQLLASLAVGVLLFSGFALQTLGLQGTSPGISGFLTSLYVVLIPLFTWLWTRRLPPPLVMAGIATALCGIGLLTVSGRLVFGWGELLTLAATVFWALHILAVSFVAPRVDTLALTTVQLAVTGVLSLGASLLFEHPQAYYGGVGTAAIVYTALTGSVVCYLLMTWGQRHTTATVAGVLMSLESVFALLFSIIFGYDPFTFRSLVGFVLAFAGTVITQVAARRAGEMPPAATEPSVFPTS